MTIKPFFTNLSAAGSGVATDAQQVRQVIDVLSGYQVSNPGPLYQFAESVSVGTGAVTFSNIPAYRNLFIVWSARSSNAGINDSFALRVNGDSGTNYWSSATLGTGTTATNSNIGNTSYIFLADVPGATATAAHAGSGWAYIPNWSDSSHALVVGALGGLLWGTASGNQECLSDTGWYTVTGTPFTSLTFTMATGLPVAGTVITLYGSM